MLGIGPGEAGFNGQREQINMKRQIILVAFHSAPAFEVCCSKEQGDHLSEIKAGCPRWIRLWTRGIGRKQVSVKNETITRVSALSWD